MDHYGLHNHRAPSSPPINQYYIVSDTSSLRECPRRVWPQQKSLHLSLSTHSLLACWSPSSISAPLSCMYFFTLSFHLTTGLSLRLGLYFTCTLSSQPFHSSFSQDDQTTSKYFISAIPLHRISPQLHRFTCHIFHTHFHCSHLPSFHDICSSHCIVIYTWSCEKYACE